MRTNTRKWPPAMMSAMEKRRPRVFAFTKWWKVVGFLSTLRLCLVRLGIWEPESWWLRPRQVQHKLMARLRGSSDMDVFFQIFVNEEYGCLQKLENVPVVLDLGANVGYSSAYFLSRFPMSRVLAVEPDGRNLEICAANLEPYGDRAILLHGAAWSERTKLSLSRGTFRDGREWASQVSSSPGGGLGDVEAWDVESLIEMAGSGEVDLLRVDIEGAERVVFGENAKTWLPKVRNLCIELHGPDCEEAFFNALAGFDYELEHSGELTVCARLRAKAEEAGGTVHRSSRE